MQFYEIPMQAGGYPTMLVGTQAEGVQACKARGIRFHAERMAVDVPTSKAELMTYINQLLDQRDAYKASSLGATISQPDRPAPVYDPRPKGPDPTQVSISLEDQFEKLPLAHQLHFAALAMENARDKLGA